MLKKARRVAKSVMTSLRKSSDSSDVGRWKNPENLSSKWDSRTARIGALVAAGDSILEFGAGRMVLRDHIPANCAYTPSDIVDRGAGTIVCDLNGQLPDFASHDVAVFSGVLEYVNNVPRLIEHLADVVKTIVVSYAVVESNPDDRRSHGWVNDYTSDQFVLLFSRVGFACDHEEMWKTQKIFRFVRATLPGRAEV
jgi:hypothetical protein